MSNDMISMQEKALAADIRHNLNDKQQLQGSRTPPPGR